MIHLYLLVSLLSSYLLFSVNAQGHNAFDNNVNRCLFDGWNRGRNAVLDAKMECRGRSYAGLCYGLKRGKALFAICYNQNTLIPEFSGHVVPPLGRNQVANTGRHDFRNERGRYAPKTQSDEKVDYEKYSQKTIVPNFNDKDRFFNRGHLTPNEAFDFNAERELTFVNTNAAPQWMTFNGRNWGIVESAIKRYANQNQRGVYVVTGTGGEIIRNRVPLKLRGKVIVPQFFWKAVCDPVAKQSIVFVAKNPSGVEGITKQRGCSIAGGVIKMKPVNGIINCYSLDGLKKRKEAKYFKLPSFGVACNPSQRGRFLDQFLRGLN